MKSLPVMLTAFAILGLAPFVGAAEDLSCIQQAPREETFVDPLNPDHFFLIDLDEPGKTGEWFSANRRAGLQTEDCGSAPVVYSKDRQNVFLP